MEDIRSILSQFHSRKKKEEEEGSGEPGKIPSDIPYFSEIPDIFFDDILLHYKLNRQEIAVLMKLYRQIWCQANLYRSHGIGPMNSHADLAASLEMNVEELQTYLRSLETYGLIETVRSGQYFIRKYFTEELDQRFSQNYHDFF